MPIAVACDVCNAEYNLRDDFAGRQVRCKSCQNLLTVPAANGRPAAEQVVGPTREYDGPFGRDKFLINQKRFAINQRYFVTDEQKQTLLVAERPTMFLRQIAGAIVAAFTLLILLGVSAFAAAALSQAGAPEAVSVGAFFLGLILAIVATILLAIKLSPKRHVTFYADESKARPLLRVLQDKKFYGFKATYTVETPDGEKLGQFYKNYLHNFFRKQWRVFAPDGSTIVVAKEDSMILSLLRRFLGPFFGLLRTNFVIIEPATDKVIGEFNRKFTLFDRYVLDMAADRTHALDRRLALALGIMLDTGERR